MHDNIETGRAIRIFLTGVGGQGTLLATRLIGEAALAEGLAVTISEIHGMAQRGGVVESSVVIGHCFSPTIADGDADILVAFEPLEALRALRKCHSHSHVISSRIPILPFTVATGQNTYPEFTVVDDLIQSRVERLLWVDIAGLARKAGSDKAANIVIVGALAGIGELPISDYSWKQALKMVIPRASYRGEPQRF